MKNILLSVVELIHLLKLWEVKIYPVLGIERKEPPKRSTQLVGKHCFKANMQKKKGKFRPTEVCDKALLHFKGV